MNEAVGAKILSGSGVLRLRGGMGAFLGVLISLLVFILIGYAQTPFIGEQGSKKSREVSMRLQGGIAAVR